MTMNAAERDLLIRTLIGEAGKDDVGRLAVMHVIQNRLGTGKWGNDYTSVVKAPKQFSLWNEGNPAGVMANNIARNDPLYVDTGTQVDNVVNGYSTDPTKGATHYYNPSVAHPDWGPQLQGASTIGQHLFGYLDGPAPARGLDAQKLYNSGGQAAVDRALAAEEQQLRARAGGATPTTPAAPAAPYTPVSNDETAANLSEYLEGNAKKLGLTNSGFEQNLLRFLNENPYGVGVKSLDRSVQQQQALWDEAVAKYGSPEAARAWVAPPGHSNHNKGLAADLSWENPDAMKWAHANASRYGLAFPLGNEDWHVEPVGARGGGSPTTPSSAPAPATPGAPSSPNTPAGPAAPPTPFAPATPPVLPGDYGLGSALAGLSKTLAEPTQRAAPMPTPMPQIDLTPSQTPQAQRRPVRLTSPLDGLARGLPANAPSAGLSALLAQQPQGRLV